MSRFKQVLVEHRVAVCLALLTSLIVVFPQVYFRIEHRSDGIYQGIELLPDSPWSARVREIQDGHGFGSIYYKDGKDNPYLLQPLGSMVVAYMGELFLLDINNTILLSRFVLPFITSILLYAFVFLFSGDKLAALVSASLILLANALLSFSGIPKLLEGVSPSSFLELARPVNSAMILIPFYGFLTSFWLFYQRRKWQWGVIGAVILGLNFYNYFYTWTFLYALGGLLVLIFIIQKKWREAARISYVFAGAIIVAIPYIYNLYQATHFPTYGEVGQRFGLVVSHAPAFVGWTVLVALLVFLFKFPREDRDKYYFGLAILLAPFITLNQQIITGRVLQEGHYHWYFHKPMAVIFVLIIIFYTLAQYGWRSYKRMLAVLIITASFATGIFIQTWSYYIDYPSRDGGVKAIERQRYGPVMKWLNENSTKEAVVFGNNETSHLTVIYTSLNAFYHRVAYISLSATTERVLDQLFTFYRLNGVGINEVKEVMYKDRASISEGVYGTYYRDQAESSYDSIPDEKLDEIIRLYQKTLSTPTQNWLYDVWEKYEVEYMVWDKIKDPAWKLDRFNFLEKIAEFGTIAVYRFEK